MAIWARVGLAYATYSYYVIISVARTPGAPPEQPVFQGSFIRYTIEPRSSEAVGSRRWGHLQRAGPKIVQGKAESWGRINILNTKPVLDHDDDLWFSAKVLLAACTSLVQSIATTASVQSENIVPIRLQDRPVLCYSQSTSHQASIDRQLDSDSRQLL